MGEVAEAEVAAVMGATEVTAADIPTMEIGYRCPACLHLPPLHPPLAILGDHLIHLIHLIHLTHHTPLSHPTVNQAAGVVVMAVMVVVRVATAECKIVGLDGVQL